MGKCPQKNLTTFQSYGTIFQLDAKVDLVVFFYLEKFDVEPGGRHGLYPERGRGERRWLAATEKTILGVEMILTE